MPITTLDLRGLACPLNWARAKAFIETQEPGTRVALLCDDPRAGRDIPRAAEAEGWAIVEVVESASAVRILIER